MKNSDTIKFIKLIIAVLILIIINNQSIKATGTLYIYQDFENPSFPPAGWTLSNTSSYDWIRTSYASGYGTGVACAVVDFYDYQSGNFEMTTNSFPSSTSGDSLIFDHAYAPATNENDRLEIYTSSNNGTTWNLLITLAGGASGPLRTAPATWDLFVPNSTQWATKSFGLPIGTNKIKFTAITAFGNNLYFDNVKIGSKFAVDCGAISIENPKWGITPQTISPAATFQNYGTTTQSFQVTMTINPGGYTNSRSVNNLLSGQSQSVMFNDFNFFAPGNYTLKTYTSLTGEQNSLNDTITNTIVVTTSPRNLVLEFCTGTWCQWCPCGEDEVHNVSVVYPNSVILAYHGAGSDPWRIFNGSSIIGLLGYSGYPSGLNDRRLGNNNGWGSFFTDAEYRYAKSPAGNVNITQTGINYNSVTRQLTVNLNAIANSTLSGQYKVNYFITENNLVYPQTGNSYCPGNSNWVHDWIVRNVVNTVTGDNVNTGIWNSGQVYPLTFTTTIDPGWNVSNCEFEVIIFKDNGALNISEIQQGFKGNITQTGISNSGINIPERYLLLQNYPNPFNPVTNIKFSIPIAGNVSLKIYNSLGKHVETYLDGFINAGDYNAVIDATNYSSGIYFYQLTSKNFTDTKSMILIK